MPLTTNYRFPENSNPYTSLSSSSVLCDPGWYRVGDDPGECQICDYGTWRSAQMNDTYCEMCQGEAYMYTTETGGDQYEDQGASEQSHCKRKKSHSSKCCLDGCFK